MTAITPDDFSSGAPPEGELTSMRERLVARLEDLRRRLRWQVGLEGLVRVLGALIGLILLGFLLDRWLELSAITRAVFLAVAATTVAVLAWRHLFSPLRSRWSPIELAAVLDDVSRTSVKNALAPRVATVLQLPGLADLEWQPSRAMIEQAVRTSFSRLETTNFLEHINRRHRTACMSALAAAAVLPAMLAAMFPSTTRLWADRWLLGLDTPWPRYTTIAVQGVSEGRLIVPRGEASVLRVTVTDKSTPTEIVWMRLENADGIAETYTLENYGGGEFRYELPPLDKSITFRLWGGDGRVGPIAVDPLDRPRVNELKLVYRSPRNLSPQSHDFGGEDGNISLFPQSDVDLTLIANVPISDVVISTETPAIRSFERVDERTFVTRWKHTQAVQMRVSLMASESGLISHPRPIAVGLKVDQPPSVNLSHSGVTSRVTAVATIPLQVLARDDFGLNSVDLHGGSTTSETTTSNGGSGVAVRANERKDGASAGAAQGGGSSVASPVPDPPRKATPPVSVALLRANPQTTETNVETAQEWKLEPMKLAPGDTVRFFAEAIDDCYSGQHTSRSRTVAFRIVPPEELFREILIRQQLLRARLRKATEEAESLRDQLRIAELPEKSGELLRRHRLIQREVWQVNRSLSDSATEMRLNQLGGPETHELLSKQVIEPLSRLHDDKLTAQRRAVEGLGRSDAEPLDHTVKRQEEIVSALQTILKSMAQWDSFIDVVNQLNSVIKLEERVRDKTEELRKSQFDSIFDK